MIETVQDSEADKDRLLGLFRQADDEAKCCVMLLTHAFVRGDETLAAGFQAMGMTEKTDGPDSIEFDDLLLLERLRQVCPMNERIWWGRYTVLLLRRNDRRLLEALKALMRRRIAC